MSTDSRELHGRTVIYTDAEEVTAQNVSEVLEKARSTHDSNADDIDYLYSYYRGKQPVLDREKTYNNDICNRIVENRAREISDFKTGYLLSAPIQYVDMAADDDAETVDNSDLGSLCKWMESAGKEASDLEVAFWQSVCGTAYRMLSPKDQADMGDDPDESPFDIFVPDPRYTFVVYSSRLSHRPMLGVTYVVDSDDNRTYYCYTDTSQFVVDKDGNVTSGTHLLGRVPIVEYPHGISREGDFEPVVPVLDAINTVQSNRVDGVEQVVQAILTLKGIDLGTDEEAGEFFRKVRENGGLQLPPDGDAGYISVTLDQAQSQTLVDSLYDAALKVCGMPNPKSGYNTSDTGAAVILRDGWSAAEAVACRTETWFKRSERSFLDMAIDFCDTACGLSLARGDVGIRFPRRNYTNDTSNVDNLVKMLSTDWVSPEQAFEHCNMFPDPHREFLRAKAWHDAQEDSDVADALGVTADQQQGAQQPQQQGAQAEPDGAAQQAGE
ncbi:MULTISPECIES: phage portal protein [unclassified Olsenella]|uniref:phage portal protein n=1 Tax=unclassified Olsenella TaxID=2638792 RepID=UPI0013149DBA|nr:MULTISPECIES: phage portal protein [unclassified Olsenella]